MFDEATIAQMQAIYQGAVNYHDKWKQTPASDARLKAMAKVLGREYKRLLDDEDSDYARLLGSIRKLTDKERSGFDGFFDPIRKSLEDQDDYHQSFKNSFK